jgi:hypothetical protein
VTYTAKEFAAKLHKCLDESDAPSLLRERAGILSKMLDIPRQQAWSILEGQLIPEHSLLQRIAAEFEVDVKWLCGTK